MRTQPLALAAGLTALLGLTACSDSPVATTPLAVPDARHATLPPADDLCGTPLEVRLLAGQHTESGSVTVANDDRYVYVSYATADGWALRRTHLEIATTVVEVPTTASGEPKIGLFGYQEEHEDVTSHTYVVPLADLGLEPGDDFIVAAHAEVYSASLERGETAWAEGPRFVDSDGSWAMYVDATARQCVVVLAPDQLCANYDDDAIGTFADANLEQAVREALEKAESVPITCGELKILRRLIASYRGIVDLAGLQNLVNLEQLELAHNEIVDIDEIAPLSVLRYLLLQGNEITDIRPLAEVLELESLAISTNNVVDVSPLEGLTALQALNADFNRIDDLAPLAPLTNLEVLTIQGNAFTDLSPLSGLTEVWFLALGSNGLTDISAIEPLDAVRVLFLQRNSLTSIAPLEDMLDLRLAELSSNPDLADIQPLLNNGGLGSGDRVDLEETSVPCDDIGALEAKGVTVESNCP